MADSACIVGIFGLPLNIAQPLTCPSHGRLQKAPHLFFSVWEAARSQHGSSDSPLMLQMTHKRWASSEYIDMIIIETSAANRERLAAEMRAQAHSIRMQQGPGKNYVLQLNSNIALLCTSMHCVAAWLAFQLQEQQEQRQEQRQEQAGGGSGSSGQQRRGGGGTM